MCVMFCGGGGGVQELGLLADAKAAYQEAIRLRPDFAIAHGNLASCFYDEGDMKTAIRWVGRGWAYECCCFHVGVCCCCCCCCCVALCCWVAACKHGVVTAVF